MRTKGLVLAALVILASGCTAFQTRHLGRADDAAGSAAPGPDLVGTWRGTVFAVGGSNYHLPTPVDLTIKPDGTWAWSKRGAEQARGRVERRGNRVLLYEDVSKEGGNTINLEHRGSQLFGVSQAFIPGTTNAVQLHKVQS